MVKREKYPDLFTSRRYSVLPEAAQEAIRGLAGSADIGRIEVYRDALSKLDPSIVAPARDEIREIGELFGPPKPLKRWLFGDRVPSSGWFLQFHANGFAREKAMRCLDDAPRSPFEFVAVVYRMNDWVFQVRRAAFDYAEQYFPKVDPEIIGKAAFFLLLRRRLLARWEPRAAKLVEDILYDQASLSAIKDRLLDETEGPVGPVLRTALRRADLDPFLPELALKAKSAAVRACAMDFLLKGRAQWAQGYKPVWVDKAYGIRRREPDLQQRPLTISVDIREHLDIASQDRSAQVRRVAASGLAEQLDRPMPWHDAIAARLKRDKTPSIASRMEFYFRKIGKPDPDA